MDALLARAGDVGTFTTKVLDCLGAFLERARGVAGSDDRRSADEASLGMPSAKMQASRNLHDDVREERIQHLVRRLMRAEPPAAAAILPTHRSDQTRGTGDAVVADGDEFENAVSRSAALVVREIGDDLCFAGAPGIRGRGFHGAAAAMKAQGQLISEDTRLRDQPDATNGRSGVDARVGGNPTAGARDRTAMCEFGIGEHLIESPATIRERVDDLDPARRPLAAALESNGGVDHVRARRRVGDPSERLPASDLVGLDRPGVGDLGAVRQMDLLADQVARDLCFGDRSSIVPTANGKDGDADKGAE